MLSRRTDDVYRRRIGWTRMRHRASALVRAHGRSSPPPTGEAKACSAKVDVRRSQPRAKTEAILTCSRYRLPDDMANDSTSRRPSQSGRRVSTSARSLHSVPTGLSGGTPTGHAKPPHFQNFLERYERTKKASATELDLGLQRHELESAPAYHEAQRHELGEYRASKSSV